MEERLIEFDISTNNVPTIWDIENAEKMQFVSFIEDKLEDKYSKKFDYYEQMLLSLQKEHSNQISTLVEELNHVKRILNNINNSQNNEMIYIPSHIYNRHLPNYVGYTYSSHEMYGMLVYNKYDTTTVYCDKFYPQLYELPNLTELKLDTFDTQGTFYNNHCMELPNVKTLEISAGHWHKQVVFPNLEHLIINVNNSIPNPTETSQAIVEFVKYYPCINKITIKNDGNFTANLELLKTYASNNGIVCMFV